MTNPETLLSLASRVEESEGPDAETAYTDLEIYRLLFNRNAKLLDAPDYHGSLDAAMSLVPEDSTGRSINTTQYMSEAILFRDGDGVIGRGTALTEPLAVAAASLRAIASRSNNPEENGDG